MLTLLRAFWSKWADLILKIVLAALTVSAVLLGAKKAGRDAERVDTMKKTLKVKNAQQKAAASGPRTRDELVDELRRGDF